MTALKYSKLFIMVIWSMAFVKSVSAQENHLEKRINLHCKAVPLPQLLLLIEKQSDFYFSYDAKLISSDSLYTLDIEDIRVQNVLIQILPSHIRFKSVGNHVILYKSLKNQSQKVKLEGYIQDIRTAKPIAYATLYSPQNNVLVSSDKKGYYQMEVVLSDENTRITISKSGYITEILTLDFKGENQMDFKLKPYAEPIEGIALKSPLHPDVNDRKLVKLIVPQNVINHSENIKLFEEEQTQFSILPGLSSNGLYNGFTTNHLSFNLLAGYSKATNGFELGGLMNINKTDMKGLQIAGMANFTGRYMEGTQISGMLNYNGLDFDGLQISGMSNVNWGDMQGAQISGFSNHLRGNMKGAQISGFANISTQNVDGSQVSGFVNYAKEDVNTLQISGFANVAKNVKGIQASGFANLAEETNDGFQASGFINYVKKNKGTQLSFINYADTSTGTPIGFFSYVKNGYHILEVSATEHFPVHISFKTGVNKFYNIFELGFNDYYFLYSYGFGSKKVLSSKWAITFDLTFSQLIHYKDTEVMINEHRYLFKFTPSIEYKLTDKIAIAIGPSLNQSFAYYAELGSNIQTLSRNPFYIESTHYGVDESWVGARLALRFF